MKKFIAKILLAATAFIVSLGFIGSPVYVYAEESLVPDVPITEMGEELPENGVEDESADAPENDVQTPTADDNTNAEEIPEVSEKEENTEDLEHTFEDFLAWAEQEADRYGYGDEFSKAVEAIKAAATQEQVTLSTIGSIAMMVAVLAYTLYKKVTDSKFKSEVHNLSVSLNAQLEKLKELVDGTNSNTKTEEEIKAEEQALKEEAICTKEALAHLINAFMHFSSHVGMSNANKAEVQRDCMNALKCIDGEVTANESNEV